MAARVSVIAVVLLLGLAGVFTACSSYVTSPNEYRFESNGQRIYYTATSSSGEPISYTGSFRMMHPITCVNCHGTDGRGGRVSMMMQTFDTPDITWHALTEEEHHDGEAEEHEEHPPYTEATVKRAITDGVDPAGEPLDAEMPRWQMSAQDMNDLVDFLKTLD